MCAVSLFAVFGLFLGRSEENIVPLDPPRLAIEIVSSNDAPPEAPADSSHEDTPRWMEGEAVSRRLRESIGPAGIVWTGTPLRQALEGLAQTSRIAVLLDRRVDPGQLLDLKLENCSLLEALAIVANDRSLGMTLVGPVVYFGPTPAASRLRTLIAMAEDQLQTLPEQERRKFVEKGPLAWPDLATPREILQELATSAGLSIENLERVPHDLWARGSLPSLPLVHRLCLVLNQFDLTFQVQAEGRAIRCIPLPERIALVRSYPGGANLQKQAQQIARLVPEAEVRLGSGKVWVRGRLEDHYQIAAALGFPLPAPDPGWELEKLLKSGGKISGPPSSASSPPVPPEQFRIESLRIRNKPLREVLDLLSARMNLEFQINEDVLRKAGLSLDQQISFEVRHATVDELLEKIFHPLRLSFQRRGHVVLVQPGP